MQRMEDEEWELKAVLDDRQRDGVRYFKIRWAHSWLPEEQLVVTSAAAVKAYLKRKEKKLGRLH